MDGQAEHVTVYRSMDVTAEDDCRTIIDLLTAEGIPATLLDDSSPGVPEGTWELQVAAGDASRAEQIIAENPLPDEVEEFDPSHDLDLVSVFHNEGSTLSELEATGLKSLLEANGIMAVIGGDSVLPNLPFDVMVARDQAERAKELILEAQAAGPAAAEEASGSWEKTVE